MGAKRAADALRVPSLPVRRLCLEVRRHVVLDVRIGTWIHVLGVPRRAVVIDVVSGLLPRVEYDLVEGVVGMQGGDDALGGVVEQHGADADLCPELKPVSRTKERLVLADGLALVVEDGPAAADPTRVDLGAA